MSFLERVRLIFWTASLDNDKELVKFPLIAFQVRSLAYSLIVLAAAQYSICIFFSITRYLRIKNNAVNFNIEISIASELQAIAN